MASSLHGVVPELDQIASGRRKEKTVLQLHQETTLRDSLRQFSQDGRQNHFAHVRKIIDGAAAKKKAEYADFDRRLAAAKACRNDGDRRRKVALLRIELEELEAKWG